MYSHQPGRNTTHGVAAELLACATSTGHGWDGELGCWRIPHSGPADPASLNEAFSGGDTSKPSSPPQLMIRQTQSPSEHPKSVTDATDIPILALTRAPPRHEPLAPRGPRPRRIASGIPCEVTRPVIAARGLARIGRIEAIVIIDMTRRRQDAIPANAERDAINTLLNSLSLSWTATANSAGSRNLPLGALCRGEPKPLATLLHSIHGTILAGTKWQGEYSSPRFSSTGPRKFLLAGTDTEHHGLADRGGSQRASLRNLEDRFLVGIIITMAAAKQ
ncbi:hypothetical protein JHW43_008194 [Diplocarpon mali]|nr:hypothetical protein JHW43_008194 [Diplocarpon mali]